MADRQAVAADFLGVFARHGVAATPGQRTIDAGSRLDCGSRFPGARVALERTLAVRYGPGARPGHGWPRGGAVSGDGILGRCSKPISLAPSRLATNLRHNASQQLVGQGG